MRWDISEGPPKTPLARSAEEIERMKKLREDLKARGAHARIGSSRDQRSANGDGALRR